MNPVDPFDAALAADLLKRAAIPFVVENHWEEEAAKPRLWQPGASATPQTFVELHDSSGVIAPSGSAAMGIIAHDALPEDWMEQLARVLVSHRVWSVAGESSRYMNSAWPSVASTDDDEWQEELDGEFEGNRDESGNLEGDLPEDRDGDQRPGQDQESMKPELGGQGGSDVAAFYRPFHTWAPHNGIFLKLEGILGIAHTLRRLDGKLFADPLLAVQVANTFLQGHELFHHRVEAMAFKAECEGMADLFTGIVQPFYALQRAQGKLPDWNEEALAEAAGFNAVVRGFPTPLRGAAVVDAAQPHRLVRAFKLLFLMSPIGYRNGAHLIPPPTSSWGEDLNAEARRTFAMACHNLANPASPWNAELAKFALRCFAPTQAASLRPCWYIFNPGGTIEKWLASGGKL